MDGNSNFFLQAFYEFIRGEWPTESRHILDCEEVDTDLFELLCESDVILQRIFRPRFVENIAGIADRSFADAAGFQHSIERNAHVFDRVQRIEYAKNIHPLCMRFPDKFTNHVVRV